MATPQRFLTHLFLLSFTWGLLQPQAIAQAESLTAQAQPGASPTQPQPRQANPYQVLHVNPTAGSDTQGSGGQRRPLQTIAYALQVAQPNTIILLAPGLYNQASGETFPLRLKPGVTIQGSPGSSGHTAVIQGGGQFSSPSLGRQNVAVVAADRAGLAHVTVSNPSNQGHGLWIESGSPVILENVFSGSGQAGIFLAGAGAPVIRGNYFYRNAIAGLIIHGENEAEIHNNRFEETGAGITVSQNAVPQIIGNQIIRNQEGLVLLAGAQPVLQNNDISQNRRNGVVEFGRSAALATARVPIEPASSPPPASRAAAASPLSARPEAPAVSPSQPAAPPTLSPDPAAARLPQAENQQTTFPADTAATLPSPGAAIEAIGGTAEIPAASQPEAIAPEPETLATATDSSDASLPIAIGSAIDNSPTAAVTAPSRQPAAKPAASTSEPTLIEASLLGPRIDIALTAASPADTLSETAPETDNGTTAALEVTAVTQPAMTPATVASQPAVPATEPAIEIPVMIPVSDSATGAAAGIDITVIPASANELTEIPVTIDAQPDWERIFARLGQKGAAPQPEAELPAVPPADAATAVPPATQPDVIELAVIPPAAAPEPAAPEPTAAEPPVLPNDLARLPAVPNSDLLLVPGPDIPVGSGGSVPYVFVSAEPGGSAADPPPPPSRATALGLYYRVIVEATDAATQAQVRSLVPDAFRVRYQDRVMMQAGAFEDQATADDIVQMLANSGLRAWVDNLQ